MKRDQRTRRSATRVSGKSRKKEQKGIDFVPYFCYQFKKSKIPFGIRGHGDRQPGRCKRLF
jgi:hypothetical protein